MMNHATQPRRQRSLRWRQRCAFALIGSGLLALTGCASGGGALDVDQLKDELEAPASRQYVIGVGDTLAIQLYNDEKMSGRMKVRSDGKISLAFLNDVQAAGKTPTQLGTDIEAGLTSVILTPKVTVTVEESAPLTISVLGEVAKPGLAVLPQRDAGVADALAAAGGLSSFAHKNSIFVVRNNPQPTRIHFTYDALTRKSGNAGKASQFRLRPGDVVIVE
jgi:polysaccharide export outer membrane protein